MKKYILDTNLYVEAIRNRRNAEELAAFSWAHLPFIHLHSVVIQELLSGAVGARGRKEIYRRLIRPFEKRNRVLTPGYSAWKRSGEIISEMVEAGRLRPGSFSRSFLNDVLIAASLTDLGGVLVTRNTNDFERIQPFQPFEYAEPWPSGA